MTNISTIIQTLNLNINDLVEVKILSFHYLLTLSQKLIVLVITSVLIFVILNELK